MRALYLILLNFAYYLRSFPNCFKDLEYLTFGCDLIYIIYLSIIIENYDIENYVC